MSPGRALLEVKEKLKNYRRQDDGGSVGAGSLSSDVRGDAREGGRPHPEERQPTSKGRFDDSTRQVHKSDTNVEIAEIDSRLQALQEFLKSAKQSSSQ